MRNAKRVIPIGLIVLLGMVFFVPVLLGRKFLWGDVLYQYYPYTYFLFGALRTLTIPVWNPYVFSGMPFLGDVQSQIFYPLNWLLALLSSSSPNLVYWLLEFKIILHVILGGVFMYLLLRDMKLSRHAALFSGVTFMLSGFMITHTIHETLITTFAWFPLLLLFFLRVLRGLRLRDALFAGLALGAANLASHPQMTLHMLYSLGLILLLSLITFSRHPNPQEERGASAAAQGRIALRTIGLFLVVVTAGFGIAAVSYIPAWEHSRLTLRELVSFEQSAEGSLPPFFPLLMLVPKFFGSIAGDNVETVRFWGSSFRFHYWETCLYLGILPLALAVFGAMFNRTRERTLFLILTLVALIAALGKNTPFYWLIFKLVPGFDLFRIPSRFIGVVTLGVSALAGLGLETVVGEVESRRPKVEGFLRWLAATLGVAAIGWLLLLAGVFRGITREPELYANAVKQSGLFLLFLALTVGLFWIRPRTPARGKQPASSVRRPRTAVWASLAIALAAIDLFIFGMRFNLGAVSAEEYYRPGQTVRRLQEEAKNEPFRVNMRVGNLSFLKQNEGMVSGLELVEGFTPLGIADYSTFRIPLARKYDLLNTKYRAEVVDSARGAVILIPNPTGLPRARMVYDYLVEPDHKKVLDILGRDDFDYVNRALLEKEPGIVMRRDSLRPGNPEIQITRRTPDRMELTVKTDQPGILLLSEIFYPKWQATVNGKPSEILRADYCLRAIALAAGTHDVVLRYGTTSLAISGLLSALTLLVAVGLLIFTRQRRSKE